jgi:hypothetical protein
MSEVSNIIRRRHDFSKLDSWAKIVLNVLCFIIRVTFDIEPN